jgi:hypothetical protein
LSSGGQGIRQEYRMRCDFWNSVLTHTGVLASIEMRECGRRRAVDCSAAISRAVAVAAAIDGGAIEV